MNGTETEKALRFQSALSRLIVAYCDLLDDGTGNALSFDEAAGFLQSFSKDADWGGAKNVMDKIMLSLDYIVHDENLRKIANRMYGPECTHMKWAFEVLPSDFAYAVVGVTGYNQYGVELPKLIKLSELESEFPYTETLMIYFRKTSWVRKRPQPEGDDFEIMPAQAG